MSATPPEKQARAKRQPRVVAELGRPETAEETAARKAENSRLYRQRKTINNLILSLLATLGVVAIIFFAVPRPDSAPNWEVEYLQIAEDAQLAVTSPLVTPHMPADWKANSAKLKLSADKVTTWSVGFITPTNEYIGYRQALQADASWLSNYLEQLQATSTVTIGGLDWQVYDNRSAEDAGNLAYALVTTANGDTFVLNGTANDEEFAQAAAEVATQIEEAW